MITHVPPPEPNCPHCGKELEGWSEPGEDITLKEFLIGAAVIVLFLMNFIGAIMGIGDGLYGNGCKKPFSKRYDYVMPTNIVTCAATRWLDSKPVYSE